MTVREPLQIRQAMTAGLIAAVVSLGGLAAQRWFGLAEMFGFVGFLSVVLLASYGILRRVNSSRERDR